MCSSGSEAVVQVSTREVRFSAAVALDVERPHQELLREIAGASFELAGRRRFSVLAAVLTDTSLRHCVDLFQLSAAGTEILNRGVGI